MFAQNSQFEIKTPNGWEDFSGVQKVQREEKVTVFVSLGGEVVELAGSPDHKIKTENGWTELQWVEEGTKVETQKGFGLVFQIEHDRERVDLFDIVDSGKDHCYFSNDILSHNCEFIGSASTLISPSKLTTMTYMHPLRSKDGVDIYEEPKLGHKYVVTADCARGLRLDYSAFTVIDVSVTPYKLVAKFRDNTITPMIYPQFLVNIGHFYNQAHILIETNDVGGQVAESVAGQFEYENVLKTVSKGRGGFQLGEGKDAKLGVTTSQSVKKKGCSNLKSLLETDKLLIEDYDTYVELTTFTRKTDNANSSFAAEPGTNDDLVMCLVLFSWCVGTPFWKELTGTDTSKQIYQDELKDKDDSLPMGFLSLSDMKERIVDGSGDVWVTTDNSDPLLPDWYDEVYSVTDFYRNDY